MQLSSPWLNWAEPVVLRLLPGVGVGVGVSCILGGHRGGWVRGGGREVAG